MSRHSSTDNSLELFRGEEIVLPRVHDNETLYSWCARYHRLSCNSSSSRTLEQLFAVTGVRIEHAFPLFLDNFQSRTQARLGSLEDIVRWRTSLGFHLPFLSTGKLRAILETMRTGKGVPVRLQLGITKIGLADQSIFKACPACMEEDRNNGTTAWWHQDQQWPGIQVCQRHGVLLWTVGFGEPRNRLRGWFLPTEAETFPRRSSVVSSHQLEVLIKLAQVTHAVVTTLPPSALDDAFLRFAYLLQAKQLGYVAMDGSLRFRLLCNAMAAYYAGLENHPGLSPLNTLSLPQGGMAGTLLRQYPGARHPLKHLLLIAFLFEDISQFFEAYDTTCDTAAVDGFDGLRKQLTETQTRLQGLVEIERKSVNAASIELGVQVAQAIRHLKTKGVEYHKRPRILTPELKNQLDKQLLAGEDRAQIASALEIRKAFIKDYLAGQPKLREAWKRVHTEMKRKRYRENFLQVLAEYPGVPIKRIRRISGNGFQWLYGNDREWLASHLPDIWHRPDKSIP